MTALQPAWSIEAGDHPVALAWAADAAWLAVGGAGGAVWIVTPDGRVAVERVASTSGLGALAWSPTAPLLAAAGHDGAVRLVDPAGALETVLEAGVQWAEHLAWHPRGKRLAVARGKHVLLLDPRDWRAAPVGVGPFESTVAALAWSPGGRQLAVAGYGGSRASSPRCAPRSGGGSVTARPSSPAARRWCSSACGRRRRGT